MVPFRTWGIVAATCVAVGTAHTVITYPGWRGNNLDTTDASPYGMQWSYPCGGLPLSTNRTNWPVGGGAIALQPGWFTGHKAALIYINLGLGTDGPDGGPENMSFPMQGPFQIDGPSNLPYPGMLCLPQVPLPDGVTVNVGDHATIQIVETTIHGAALYNCVDITFALPENVSPVNETNCFNSSDISIDPYPDSTDVAAIASITSPVTSSSATRRVLFSTLRDCTPCSACPTSTASLAPSACPTGNLGAKEGLGVGIPLGVLALGILGL